MSNKPLNDKQIQAIEMLVEGEKNLNEICDECSIPRTTFWEWRKHNTLFQETLEEALEYKADFMKQSLKGKFQHYINGLEKIVDKGKNEAARVNALSKLIALAGLDPSFKQEISVIKKDESEHKNKLKEMLKSRTDSQEDNNFLQ